MKNLINWKLFFILFAACTIGSVLVLPYSMDLTSTDLEAASIESGIPVVLMLIISIVQSTIMFAIVTFLGLLLSKKIGLENGGFRLPILEGILNRENKSKEFKSLLLPSICLGVLAGGLILVINIPFNNAIPEFKNMEKIVPAWKGFLASFYGGIAEEVLLRLFFMSLLVWISTKIKKISNVGSAAGSPVAVGVWIAIILAAVVFGLGHLPATAAIVELNAVVVARAIILNSIVGIICGWLFWKKGLEAAMISHFSADIVLHVITPLVMSLFV